MDWVACVGVDWADKKHDWAVVDRNGKTDRGRILSTPEAVDEWVRKLREDYPGGPIIVAVEQSRGALIHQLMRHDFVEVVPINPRASKSYRDSLRTSGAKDDPVDADLVRDFAAKHLERLRVWKPGSVEVRRLGLLVEGRRWAVDQRTAHTNALTAVCKQYFPQILEWFDGAGAALALAFLQKWPTLEEARTARRDAIVRLVRAQSRWSEEKIDQLIGSIKAAVALTDDAAIIEASALMAQSLSLMIDLDDQQIREYEKKLAALWEAYPQRAVFDSFPGAGAVMAPRLAAAFGLDHSRWADAREIQTFSGIAPVVEASGKQRWVHARWRCPKFLRQSFHEFAQASLPKSSWALAFYREQKARGRGHHAAVRALAYRWIRILFRCWKNDEPYDEQRYLKQLAKKGSPIIARLAP